MEVIYGSLFIIKHNITYSFIHLFIWYMLIQMSIIHAYTHGQHPWFRIRILYTVKYMIIVRELHAQWCTRSHTRDYYIDYIHDYTHDKLLECKKEPSIWSSETSIIVICSKLLLVWVYLNLVFSVRLLIGQWRIHYPITCVIVSDNISLSNTRFC